MLDTNVLAYAEGLGDTHRCGIALALAESLPASAVLLPVQVVGELMRVLTHKAGYSAQAARQAVLEWADAFEVVDSTWPAMQGAMDLVTAHAFSLWDALILSVSAENHCRYLLSEDMQHGFTWRGVTVINPFAPDFRLDDLMDVSGLPSMLT